MMPKHKIRRHTDVKKKESGYITKTIIITVVVFVTLMFLQLAACVACSTANKVADVVTKPIEFGSSKMQDPLYSMSEKAIQEYYVEIRQKAQRWKNQAFWGKLRDLSAKLEV